MSPADQHAIHGIANCSARIPAIIPAIMTSHQQLVVAGMAMANGRNDGCSERVLLERSAGAGASFLYQKALALVTAP